MQDCIRHWQKALGKGRLAELHPSHMPLEQERSAIASSAVGGARVTKQSSAVGGAAQLRSDSDLQQAKWYQSKAQRTI